jgi:hypothetical protein
VQPLAIAIGTGTQIHLLQAIESIAVAASAPP